MDKGTALNRRVWRLFERAGFQTRPNSRNEAEYEVELSPGKKRPVDLYAEAPGLGVTILGSNKSGKKIDSWTDHVSGYAELGKRAGADKVLFVITGKELSAEERQYVVGRGMCVWGEDQLSYYEAVADAIKSYAKYEIINALDLRTKDEKDTHRVLALRLRQPTGDDGKQLFMFTIAPERLLRTCVVYRRAQGNAAAYQRMLRKNRLPRIAQFVSGAGALLPTNIILHLGERVTVDDVKVAEFRDLSDRPITLSKMSYADLVVLNIPMEYASIELIDGQHRLYGFVDAEGETKQKFHLVALGVKGLGIDERRDAFVGINANSRRMDPNLVSYLKYTDNDAACQGDSELMAIRIVVDLNRTTPFAKSIRLLDVGKQRITLKGFSGYDLRGLLGPRGLLRKYYPSHDASEYVRVLRMYFSTIRGIFKKEWDDPQKYIIATNRGIAALLKLLKSMLGSCQGAITAENIRKYLEALKAGWRTWETAKLRKTYVGSQGWKEFHRDLVEKIQRKYPEFQE